MKIKEILILAIHPKNWRMLFSRYREVCMYVIFGIGTTIVSFASYYLFRQLFPNADSVPSSLRFIFTFTAVFSAENNTVLPVILSWLCSVTFAYITNRLWVFSDKAHSVFGVIVEAVKFFGARVLTLLVDIAVMYLLVDMTGFYNPVYELCAKLFSSVIVTVLNYFLSKFLVFRKKNLTKAEK